MDKRTAVSEEWRTRDGGRVTRLATAPTRWKDEAGSWQPLDLALQPTASGAAQVADVADAQVLVPTDQDGDSDAVVRDGASVVRFHLRGARRTEGVSLGDYARKYPDVLNGVTQRVSTIASGLKEELVLHGPSAPRRFVYDLKVSDGLTPTVAQDGSLRIRRGTSTIFTLPRVVSYEAAQPTVRRTAAAYELRDEGRGSWAVVVDVDDPWFRDPERQWPVVVDPTITIDRVTNATGSCIFRGGLICEGAATPAWATSGWGSAGESDGSVAVGTGPFSLPAILAGRTVTEAKLHLSTSNSVNDTGRAQQLEAAGSEVTQSGWQPRWPMRTLAVVGTSGAVSFDVTAEIRQWQAQDGGATYNPPLNKWLWATVRGNPRKIGGGGPLVPGSPCFNEEGHEMLCDSNRVDIATVFHPDPDRRPYLDVYSAAPAQAGSEIGAPAEGKLSSRFVELFAKVGSAAVTTAKFEYVAGDSREWQTIPLAALRNTETGEQPSSTDIPVTGGGTSRSSASLSWDLSKTPGGQVDGPVHVRAILEAGAGGGGGVTAERNLRIDRKNPETSSTEQVGPIAVDLLTGDATVTETDVDIDAFINDLRLTRTYHSRGGSPRTSDMFGPGWISSFDIDGGEMPYRSIHNFVEVEESEELVDWIVDDSNVDWEAFDPADFIHEPVYETRRWETTYAVLEKTDGAKITFRQDGSNWIPDAEHNDLKITKSGTRFTVRDGAGNTTTFEPEGAGSPNYRPSAYEQAGSAKDTTFQYDVAGGHKRLLRIVAPNPAGAACDSSSWPEGCRGLELQWDDEPVGGGKTEKRVKAVVLRAADPSGQETGTVHPVFRYEYDGSGRLSKAYDPRTTTGLPIQYAYDSGGRLTSYAPTTERPWAIDYASIDGDNDPARVRSIKRQAPTGADATTTFVYDVPLSGVGAPRDLSGPTVRRWGQADLPQTGTAVFPPGTAPGSSGDAARWNHATISYLGVHGKAVNVLEPGGGISTAQFDRNGNLVRSLTPENRERALQAVDSVGRARLLETQIEFAPNGVDVVERTGPEHAIRRPDGSTFLGREHSRMSYDVGKPASIAGDQHLLSVLTTGAVRSSDNVNLDEKETTYTYADGADIRGWQVKLPLTTTVGTGAEATTTRFKYHPTLPLLTEKRMPKSSGGDSYSLRYFYYGVGADAPAWCSNVSSPASVAAAAGMVCASVPAGQPSSGPALPGTYTRYSLLWAPIEERQAASPGSVGSPLRTTTIGRDKLGRETSKAVTGTGRPIPTVTSSYDTLTGRLIATRTGATGSDSARSITRAYNDNGAIASYTDADGETTEYGYDIAGRSVSTSDPRGTRTLTYDDRDLVTGIRDSTLPGAITAVRDDDGNVVEQTFPGGLKSTTQIDANGDTSSLIWEKTTNCSTACNWVQSRADRDAQGRIAKLESNQSAQTYSYDSTGRLKTADEVRGTTCTARGYAFDKNSNRTAATTTTSAPGGPCGTGSVVSKSNTVDGADRLTNPGYDYDALGRTTTVPGADSADGQEILITYDVDGLASRIDAGSDEQLMQRDPLRRMRYERSTSVSVASVLHYSDDLDQPTGKTGTAGWQRSLIDVDGEQVGTADSAGAITWNLSDIHGDVVATASGSGTLTSRTEYDPFGVPTLSTGGGPSSGLTLGWLGSYGKGTAIGGIVHMGARLYLPTTGRFLQPDPIEGGSANAYDYALQDPLNTMDLDGRSWVKKAARAAAAMGSAAARATVKAAKKLVPKISRNAAKNIVKSGLEAAGLAGKEVKKKLKLKWNVQTNTTSVVIGIGVSTKYGSFSVRIDKPDVHHDNYQLQVDYKLKGMKRKKTPIRIDIWPG